ncbi:hypothetical protein HBB16_16775 [Pseudonocardia sp. MCCB 268]|nr:hypothetical protein [Pseudonocardia cytotoxica]
MPAARRVVAVGARRGVAAHGGRRPSRTPDVTWSCSRAAPRRRPPAADPAAWRARAATATVPAPPTADLAPARPVRYGPSAAPGRARHGLPDSGRRRAGHRPGAVGLRARPPGRSLRRVRGRALAAELTPRAPTWECTHLGGHRFAPTALVLPTGARSTAGSTPVCAAALKAAVGGNVDLVAAGTRGWNRRSSSPSWPSAIIPGIGDATALQVTRPMDLGAVAVHATDGPDVDGRRARWHCCRRARRLRGAPGRHGAAGRRRPGRCGPDRRDRFGWSARTSGAVGGCQPVLGDRAGARVGVGVHPAAPAPSQRRALAPAQHPRSLSPSPTRAPGAVDAEPLRHSGPA